MSKSTKSKLMTNKELVKATHIRLAASQTAELSKKFGCTTQMVRNACKYTSLTELSDQIRQGAKELLISEANKI